MLDALHHIERQEAASSGVTSRRAGGARPDVSILIEAIEADPDRLLQHVLDKIRRSDKRGARERRTGQATRFGTSLEIVTSGPEIGKWSDYKSIIKRRDGQPYGNLWQLAEALGFSREDIARLYHECWSEAPPKALAAIRRKARQREIAAADEAVRLTKADDAALRDNIKRHSVEIDGELATYVRRNRRLNHRQLKGQVLVVDRPTVVSKKEGVPQPYRLPYRCLFLPITNGSGDVVGAQLTQINKAGQKALAGHRSRMSLGLVSQGYGRVGRLSSDRFVMGEGLETVGSALAADSGLLGLVSAGNIRVLHGDPMLRRAKEIFLLADRDKIEQCRAKASELARAAPRAVIRLVVPPKEIEGAKADLNDVHQEAGIGAVRRALTKAEVLVEPTIGRGEVTLSEGQVAAAEVGRSFFASVEAQLYGQRLKARAHAGIEAEITKTGYHTDDPEAEKIKRRAKAAATGKISRDLGVSVTGRGPRLLLEGTPAVGKTFETLRKAGAFMERLGDRDDGFTLAVLLPTGRTAMEKFNEFREQFPNVEAACIRGRASQVTTAAERVPPSLLERSQDGAAMCPRHEAYNSISRRGIPGQRVICGSCPLAEQCAYQKQAAWLERTKGQARVVFGVHAHAVMPAAQRPWGRQDALIVDESIINSMSALHEIPMATIADADVVGKLVCRGDLADTMATATALAQAVKAGKVEGLGIDQLKAFKRALRDFRPSVFTISGQDSDQDLIDAAAKMPGRWRDTLLSLASDAIHHLRNKRREWQSISIERNERGELVARWISGRRLNASRNCHILALDGTSRDGVARLVFGDHLRTISVKVPRNVNVTQTVGANFSRQSLLGCGRENEDGGVAGIGCLMGVLESLQEVPGRVLLGADKRVIEEARKRSLDTHLYELWDRISTVHLGAGSATNAYQDIGTVIIVGRLSPPPEAIERQGYALSMLKGRPIVTIADHMKGNPDATLRQDGYIDRGGQPWHPDPLCEELRWTVTNASMIQLIDRTRPARKSDPVNVILINAVELPEFPADRLIKASSVRSGHLIDCRFQQYLHAMHSLMVVPISSVYMRRLAPDMFPSENSARHVLQRAVRASTGSPIKKAQNSYKEFTAMGLFKLPSERLTCRVRVWCSPGQRNPHKALAEPGFTDADIERVFGKVHRWELVEPEPDLAAIAERHQEPALSSNAVAKSERQADILKPAPSLDRAKPPSAEIFIREAVCSGCRLAIPNWNGPKLPAHICPVCGEPAHGVRPTHYQIDERSGRRVHAGCLPLVKGHGVTMQQGGLTA